MSHHPSGNVVLMQTSVICDEPDPDCLLFLLKGREEVGSCHIGSHQIDNESLRSEIRPLDFAGAWGPGKEYLIVLQDGPIPKNSLLQGSSYFRG